MPRGPLTTPWAILAPLIAFALIAAALVAGGLEAGDEEERAGATAEPGGRGTVVVGHPRGPTSLNRTMADDPLTDRVTAAVAGEHLLTRTAEGEYLPQLAEAVPDVEPVGDGMAVTFRIRAEASWSDGVAVSSRDVAFTWRTLTDPDNQVAGAAGWNEIADVETPDPQTAIIVFRRPFAGWRTLFASPAPGAGSLLPAHRLAGRGLLSASLDAEGIGTGPYRVEEHLPGDRLTLAVSESYWDTAAPRPRIGRIVHVFLDEDELVARLRDGTVDLVSPADFTVVEQLRSAPDTMVAMAPGPTSEHLYFNAQDPVMQDPNVRRAIARAIDPKALIETIAGEPAPIESVLLPQEAPFFVPAWEQVTPDRAEMERLLGLAGYDRDPGGGYSRAGRPLEIDLVAIKGTDQRALNLAAIAGQLRAAGIASRTRIDGQDVLAGRFQVALSGASADAGPSLRARFGSDRIPAPGNGLTGRNLARISDDQLDTLLAAADAALDEPERVRLSHLVQRRLVDLMVGRPLYRWPQVVVHRDDLTGVELSPSPLGPFADVSAWAWANPGG